MPEVLCIGHAAWDISVFVPGYPRENSKGETDQLLEAGGGPAANAAYLLSLWGVGCAFAGLLGDDMPGRRIISEFEAVGTNLSLVEIRPGHLTPTSVVVVNVLNGSRTLINRRAKEASMRLDGTTLGKMSPRVLLFDGHELDASLAALEAFPGAVSILDAGSSHAGTSVLAGKVDYLVASEKFAVQTCKLANLDEESIRAECVSELRQRYTNKVVVTLGEQGLIAHDGSGYWSLPAFKATAVDTTAAGDIFHGAFAYAVAQRMGFREALRLASMAASLSVRRRGGRPSIPTLAEVKQALAYVE